jgi:hypothetical protein
MRKNKLQILSLTLVISALPALSYANNWSGYRGVERRPYHESQQTYQPPAQDPFAFSNQRYTPTAPPKAIIINPTKIITTLTNIAQVSVLNTILRLTLNIHITERHL